MNRSICPACLTPGAPPADCTECGQRCCDGCLHHDVCSLCIDIWTERHERRTA